jgi:hypothetical protein
VLVQLVLVRLLVLLVPTLQALDLVSVQVYLLVLYQVLLLI